jgi:predicted nucleotidyltransferase
MIRPMAVALPALWGSSTFPRVLAIVLDTPDREFTFAELLERAGASRESVHRALLRGVEAGIISRRPVGNQFVYSANSASAIYRELKALVAKTHGANALITEALKAVGPPAIELAFVYGSTASGREHADSDIDVLVIGDVTRVQLARKLRAAQESLRRRINALAYTRDDVLQRLAGHDAFFAEVWAQPKVMLIGDEKDLPQPTTHTRKRR